MIHAMSIQVSVFSFESTSPGNTITSAGQAATAFRWNRRWMTLMDTLSLRDHHQGWNFFIPTTSHFCNGSSLQMAPAKSHLPGNFSPDHYRWRLQMYFPSPFLDADSAIIYNPKFFCSIFFGGSNTYNEIDFTNTSPVSMMIIYLKK